MMRLCLAIALVVLATSLASAAEPRTFVCREPLPQFTLGEASDPTDDQLQELCNCVWTQFPEGGWEQSTSKQIRAGDNPGWRGRAFQSRFSQALETCGGFSL